MKIKKDCRFFRNDRPCIYHKREGSICNKCSFYEKIGFRILIIKLDAMGDVMRTTCILQGLHEKYPNSQICWLTKKESLSLLQNNQFIDILWSLEEDAFLVLNTDRFDLVINPDASPTSARLATMARCKQKIGFAFDSSGYVSAIAEKASSWFLLGVNDSLKKANTKTYQHLLLELCDLRPSHYDLIYNLKSEEIDLANSFMKHHKLDGSTGIVGLNTGASARWPLKQWTIGGYIKLIRLLLMYDENIRVLLFGGMGEQGRNRYIMSALDDHRVVDTGSDNSLREFAALLSIPDVIVTGDTLAMHIAIALKRQLVVMFGPTSYNEIDLYSQGVKIIPPIDCVVCYKENCDKSPTCMEMISAESVYNEVLSRLGRK